MKPLLQNKVAIITGGAGTLGSATARLFVEEGARVVIADIDAVAGQQLAETLGPEVAFRQTDVAQPAQMKALVDFTVSHFGGLHVMFNNAGCSGEVHPRLFDEDFADFQQVMATNLLSVMTGSRYAAMHMANNGGGSIINTSSLAGIHAGPPILSYRAAKAGVIHFSQCIARDVAEYGIRVNCVAPGRIPANMTFYDMSEAIRRHQPLQRQGQAGDLANAALYLASDMSLHTTGLVLTVDGGAWLGDPLEESINKHQ